MAPRVGKRARAIRLGLAMLRDSPRVGVNMDLEQRIKHLKELIPLLPIRKTIPLQRELVQLERKLKEQKGNPSQTGAANG